MSEEHLPQRITAYRLLYLRNGPAYLRRARLFLSAPDALAGGFAFLLFFVWCGVTVAVALLQERALLLLLLFAAAVSLPVLRVLSFRRTLRVAPNIYLTEGQKPSAGEGIAMGLIGFLVLAGTAETFRGSPAAHIVLTLLGSGILFYVFRVHTLLLETFNYYRRVPVAEGGAIPEGAERMLRAEYEACAPRAPGVPAVRGLFLTKVADLQFGTVAVGEENRRDGLAVGLPLLQSLTPEQFRAYLLSECLSWSVPAGRLYHRYVDRYVSWNRFLSRLDGSSGWGSRLYAPLHNLIYPRLTAHLFLLSRLVRRQADSALGSMGLGGALQDALANQAYRHRIFEKSIWFDMYRQADDAGITSLEPFTAIQGELSAEQDREEAKLVLNESMVSWSRSLPLVPGASERLAMLQVRPFVPEPGELSAADYYFGDRLGEVIGAADTSWSRTFFDMYGELLVRRREAREELEGVLEQVEICGEERAEEKAKYLWRAAQIQGGLAEGDDDLEVALDFYLRAVAVDPGFRPARLAAARLLLDRDDREGFALLDPILNSGDEGEEWMSAYTIALEYLQEKELKEEADAFVRKNEEVFRRVEQRVRIEQERGEEERGRIEPEDRLVGHNLDEPALRHVVQILERYDRVAAALLVRKDVRFLPEYPFYLLGLEISRRSSRGLSDPAEPVLYAQRVAEELQFLPGGMGVLLLNNTDKIGTRLRSVPGGEIYRRSSSRAARID